MEALAPLFEMAGLVAFVAMGVFARIDNVFDTESETFGLLGDPEEVLGPAFTDPRVLGVGAERGAWIGIEVAL